VKQMPLLVILLLPMVALAQVEFETITVASGFEGALNVRTADLDGDGDIDVVGAAETSDQFAWWENTGIGWTYHFLGEMYWATGLDVADMDSDGDIDICGAPPIVDNVCWFENDGDGNFTLNELVTYGGARNVVAADIDADSDMDMIVCWESGNEVAWLENIGDATNWPSHVIGTFSNANNLDVDDLDGDGDPDVAVCGSGGDVGWFSNDGGSWTLSYLNESFGDSRCISIADMDGDGLQDIMAASRSDDIAWWENGADVWPLHYITTTFDGADAAYPVDLDMDGDMDVVGAAVLADEIAWFEQDGGMWTHHTIDNTMDYASGIWADDVDQDGDLDVLGAAYYSDTIMLYSQVGTPEPDPVTLTLTPQVTAIPAEGGTVIYDAHLLSVIGNRLQGVRYWTTVIMPDQSEVGPLFEYRFTLSPFMDHTAIGLTQDVPGNAATGTYIFVGHFGYFNNPNLQISDSFSFTKTGAATTDFVFDPKQWQGTGFTTSEDSDKLGLLPIESSLIAISPNPFNASTVAKITLSQPTHVQLRVLNVLGREIALLHSGALDAGSHEFMIDGGELATGIYFLTGTIGEQAVAQKLVLLK
jgi:FG-GAP-like repeat